MKTTAKNTRRSITVPFLLLALFSLLLAAGCSKGDKQTEWDLTAYTDQLRNSIEYTDTLDEMDPELMNYLFSDVNPADVEEQIIYISTGTTAEEIAAFKAIDEEAAKRIEEGLTLRVESQIESFTDYVPAEVKRLEDAVLVRNGRCVILSVSGDPDTAKEILK